MESPYEVLLVDRDADEEEIEQAYRRRILETHPDHGGTAEEFQRVRAAYEELSSDGAVVASEVDGVDIVEEPDERERSEERPRETTKRVEYIDYEVLDDYGWNLDDDDLFEKAAAAELDAAAYGRIAVEPGETLLEAAENRGFTWPFACRGGACANCAVTVTDGDLSMPVNHILPADMVDRGIRLSCVGAPTTDAATVVFNVKHLPDLDELRLPPRPFTQAHHGD